MHSILASWHVPTNVIAFQKMILDNRNKQVGNHLSLWRGEIEKINDLTKEEQCLLEALILQIDPEETEFTLKRLYEITEHASQRYLGKFVLLKYLPNVTYEHLWNNFYRNTRGCVIDLESGELVTASLPKFFNVNEKEETMIEFIRQKLKRAELTTYIKQDGSCVSVAHHKGLVITTPGSFESAQTLWAKNFLKANHPKFLEDLNGKLNSKTFIFEYVGPENRVVVEYAQTNMILLHVIDKHSGVIASYKEAKILANQYGFAMCTIVEDDFETLYLERENKEKYKASEMEGWVLRLDEGEQTFFTKLKCQDYTEMHGVMSNALNPKWILSAMIDETLDDKLAAIHSEDIRNIVKRIVDTINAWNKAKKETFLALYQNFDEQNWIQEDVLAQYEDFQKFVWEVSENLPKKEKVQNFLHEFSKGKMDNPKEEILLKALRLHENCAPSFALLEQYDGYKAFLSKRIKEAKTALEESVEEFVLRGKENEKYRVYLEEFKSYQTLASLHEIYEEEVKEMEKETYYRLKSMAMEKVSKERKPLKVYIEQMENYQTKKKHTLKTFEECLLSYYLKKCEDEKIQRFAEEDFRIKEELKTFLDYKETFEEEMVHEAYKEEKPEVRHAILKQFFAIMRGLEADNSYEVAKELFEKLPERLKNQRAYHQQKGQLSAVLNKTMPEFYKGVFFTYLNLPKKLRDQEAKEMNFLPLAVIVTHDKETITEHELDFRDIQAFVNGLALQDNE